MSNSNYLKKLEEIQSKVNGDREASRAVLQRIGAKATNYDGGIDMNTVKSWFADSESTIKGLSDYYKANEGKWLTNYGDEFEDRLSALRGNSKNVENYLFNHKSELEDYDTLREAFSSYSKYLDEAERQNNSMRKFFLQFDSERSYNKWYEDNKKAEEFKSVLNAEDFELYSSAGANIKNPSYDDANGWLQIGSWRPFGKEIGNIVTFSRDNIEEIKKRLAMSNSNADISNTLGDYRYQYLEPNEVNIYNYYLGKGETEKAAEYLASLDETLNRRHAGEIVKGVDNTALEALFSFAAGIDQAASGFKNIGHMLKGTEGEVTTATQFAQSEMSSNNTGIWKVTNDLANTTGNMLPSILVGSFTGGLGGAATMGASATGNAYAEMRELGYDEWQSRGYAALVGASETALQYALGGISKLGGKVSGNAIGKLVSGLDNAIARTAIKVGGNMASEGLEEALQTVLEPAFKALVSGEEYEAPEWEEILYSGLLGALSAGFLEGAPTIAGEVASNRQASKLYGDKTQMLIDEALATGDGSAAKALAEKYKGRVEGGKNLRGSQINRLIEATDTSKALTATEARLTELGEKGDVRKIAEILVKQASGESLSLSEKALLRESKYAERVANELDPEKIQSGEYSSSWAENIGTRHLNATSYNKRLYDLAREQTGIEQALEEGSVAKTIANAENTTEGKFKASEDGKIIYTEGDISEEVNVNKIVSTDGGKIMVELDNGKTVDASTLSLSSAEEGVMYEMVARMEVAPDTANEILSTFKPTNTEKASMYFAGVPLAYQYGKIGYEAGLKNINLTEQEKRVAYNRGRMDAMTEAKDQTKATTSKKANASKVGKNGIIYENGFTYNEKNASDVQKASMAGIEVITKMSNLEVHVYESYINGDGKRVYSISGREGAAPNGYFTDGNKIYIDINAGNLGEGAMLYTMSHEVTHYIREWNAKGFKVLGDFLIEQYGKQGVPVNALLEAQKDKIKKRHNEEGTALPSEAKLNDMAYEELVADAMSEMLADPRAYEKLAKLKQKNRTVWQKLGEAIKSLLDKLKSLIGVYKKYTPDATEAHYVRKFAPDVYEKLQDLYLKAFVEADANYASAEKTLGDNGIAVDSKTESASIMSVRDVLDGEQQQKVAQTLAERFGVTVQEAKNWISAETALASLILNPKYSQYLDYTADASEEAIKSNSDYPQGTVDFSNICKKRRDFTEVMNRVLRNFPNHVFAATDLAKIRTIMEEEGMEVACAICYVEDRRQLDSVVAQDFIDSLALYRNGSKTRPDGKAFNANQLKAFKLIEGDSYTPSIYELISLEGRNTLKAKNPAMEEAWVKFNNARGMQSVRLLLNDAEYKRQILKYTPAVVKRKNDLGGLRIYSFSDAEMFHLIDIIQVLTDSAAVGLSIQGYTKVNEYARAVKDTGEKLNRSLIPKGDLGYHMENGKVVLDFDTVEGIDINHPDFFDNIDNPNIGNIVIGINATQIKAAMTSKFIDQIIPFHTGQSNEVLGEKGIAAWDNYKDFQSERDVKTGKKSTHQINIYTEVINAAEAEGHPITNKVEFVNKFLEVCKENDLIPRFSEFLNVDENGNFVYTEGYHKFLVDFKTFDQNTGEYLPQKPVKPIFDNEYITKLLKDYVKEQQVKDAKLAKSMPKVLDRITKEIVNSEDIKLSDRDSSPYDGKTLYADSEVYDYSFLVSLDPMTVKTMPPLSTVKVDGRISQSKTVELGLKNAASIGVEVAEDQYAIKNAYTKRDIILGKGGLQHSLDASNVSRLRTNARLSAIGGYIVQNAVPINGLTKENKQANGTYAMACLLNDGNGFVVAIVTVDEFSSKATKFDFVEITHSINGRFLAKKEDSRSSTGELELGDKSLSTTAISEISIADFLEIVNSSHQSILSNDVLAHFGVTRNPDGHYAKRVLFSERSSYAPTFYSHMGNVINDIKLEKMGAGGVVSYLKGRGVKNEEIKWSGIEAFLEGKKSVTKAELQEFLAKSQLQIEEITIDNTETPMTKERKDKIVALEKERNSLVNKVKSEWKRILGTDELDNYAGESLPYDFALKLSSAVVAKKSATPIGQEYKAAREAMKEICEESDYFGYDNAKQAYVSVLRDPVSFLHGNELNATEEAAVRRLAIAKQAWLEFDGVPASDVQYLKDLGEDVNRLDGKITEIRIAHSGDQKLTRWGSYKLKGGDNYREIIFKMPDSNYTNEAMDTHWRQFELEGVLVHTRIQDMTTSDGKKMLFIEEIQSDWHNEGAKDGYADSKEEARIEKLKAEADEAFLNVEDFSMDMTGSAGEWDTIKKTAKGTELLRVYRRAKDAYDVAMNEFVKKVPDAPFRETYHEYVLKRLLRMAAEEGYDSIGWTPAKIQDERWSDNQYHEEGKGKSGNLVGYTIEYDQDIPKFLRKYGKKWGATVGTTTVNDTEVWSMDITDSMTESVLYEGQVMYSDRVTDKKTLNFLENQEHITTYKSFVEIDGKLYSPMATKVKGDDGKYHLTKPSEIGVWQQAEEKPDSIPKFHKSGYGYYVLKKDDGGSVTAAYNPYEHSSNLVLNDQFESAYQRPNLVTVECVIPKSEMTSGYKAKYAKDSVGYLDWKSGIVAGKLKGNKRKVYLSRWLKPVRIVPDAEVASMYKDLLGSKISVPFNVVPPQLLTELEKVGVKIDYEGSPGYQYRQGKKAGDSETKLSDRDTEGMSNRTLLANALESVAQTDVEKSKLAQYKQKITLIESEQKKLSEIKAKIKELSFAKGKRDTEAIKKLQFEENQTANRINTYDKQLLNLESTAALKGVLEREKKMLRKRLEQKGKDALKAQKQKDAETVRELMTRHTESRKKAIEGRHKTELRNKIKDVVSDLNKLLLNPTKDQHVPIGLQGVVAEALDAINMDTMNAEERVAYYNDLIAKSSDPDKIAELTRKRDFFAYRDMSFKDRITALKNAYAEFKESDDPLIRNAHNDAIEDLIKNTADAVGNKSLKDMSYEQLEAVYDMYKAIKATVRNANKMFKEGRQETVTQNSEDVKVEVKEVGGHQERVLKLTKFFKRFGWNMLKPVTAMKVIGSKTFAKLFDNVRAGEDTWAVDVNEAKQFYKEMSDKYGYKKWDFKERYNFKDSRGEDFSISLEQIMSLYAYSKREQADKHLEFGGFIFDDAIEVTEKKLGVPLKYEVNDANPHRLGQIEMMEIIGKLTPEQKAFIDEMQTYLSDVMGAKGNEVSLALYDIKLYKEKNYFPLKTARYFREFDPEKSATPKIKNSGFSKKTVPQAGNPIVLSNFMDVWANHVNDMSMYHAFVLPLEDFMRVYNYSSTAGGYDSVQQYIKNAYGSQANQYIETLMNDLNGGARVDPSADPINKGISLFKKASVFASASVVVQQPSAIARALAYINPKYFVTSAGSALNLAKHKSVWAEIKKYAPVAVIKEMGYFDTGMGRSTVEWIKGNQTLKDKMDDVLSKAPAMADELSWSYIWLAVKKEIKSTTDLAAGSEEFLKRCGERFTEVITNTQVYDSVLARSGMMRSKDTGMKMATAFMAEPTTTVNMMVDGILQGKRGNKKFTASTVGAVSASIILNSMLVALVYAARDDDEDETYAEKYIGSLTSELLDGFNPLTYIPFVKDIWSIAQGYDVERSDMSVVSKLWESVEGMFSESKSGWEKVLDVTGSVSSLFGIPLKNILRDGKGVYNLIETISSGTPTTEAGIMEAIGESVKSSIPLWDRLTESKTNADRLYEAIVSGDKNQIERIKGRFKDEDAIKSALRQGLRENDPRVKEAAQAKYDGNFSKYERLAREIVAEGNFSLDNVIGAINAEISAIKKGEPTEDKPTEDKDEAISYYKASDINTAYENGDNSMALEIIDDLIKTKVANGMTEKEAKSSLRSTMTSYWKPLYKKAYESGKTSEMARIRKILYASGLYGTADEVVKSVAAWLKD